MPLPVALAGAFVAFVFGWFAAGYQHLLYRQPEYRQNPATGNRLLALRLFLAVSSAIGVGLALRPDHYDAGPALLTALFVVALLTLSSNDLERKLLPNRLMFPALALALAFCWAWPDRDLWDITRGTLLALAIAAALVALGLAVGAALRVRTTAFGLGDARLIVLLGLLLGWPLVVTALFLGVIIAGVPSLALMIAGRGRSAFSYGPFLALGGIIALLWPERFL